MGKISTYSVLSTPTPNDKLIGTNVTSNNETKNFLISDILSLAVGLEGTQYVFVAANGTNVQNAAELQAAYVTAQGMSPSITNRITVIAAPGNYDFSTVNFEMDTQYIDLVSLDGNRSIVFNGLNTIDITANDVFVRGVDVGGLNFTIANSLNLLRVENCKGGDDSFGSGTASGTFTNCIGGDDSFGGNGGTASGTFNSCTGGDSSFGGQGTASGVFTNCTGGNFSFGSFGTASGTFTNCQGTDDSFGAYATASGTFTSCTGGDTSFGGQGTASGEFTSCIGLYFSFGGGNWASGTFTNCIGANYSFGGQLDADGVFNSCIGGDFSFGGDGGTASGTFNSCIGGNYSFGKGGVLNGFLYYCRLTLGTFQIVSGGGRTVLCIDGNKNQNNQ
jgi:hypothetical protein